VSNPASDVTALLRAWGEGDNAAGDRLFERLSDHLRRRAAVHFRRERPDHTLQATVLVHEAYLRLVDQERMVWQNRAQFLALASRMMRGS